MFLKEFFDNFGSVGGGIVLLKNSLKPTLGMVGTLLAGAGAP